LEYNKNIIFDKNIIVQLFEDLYRTIDSFVIFGFDSILGGNSFNNLEDLLNELKIYKKYNRFKN
jgi:hypothetical protein